MINPR
jgi:hypothetical protein